jgi:hypothetical protein
MKDEKNYFSLLLNVHMASDVKQTELHTAKPLVPNPKPSEVENDNEELERHNSPSSD